MVDEVVAVVTDQTPTVGGGARSSKDKKLIAALGVRLNIGSNETRVVA